jgi:hypothetical protein
MTKKKLKPLLFNDDLKDPVVELCRVTYKSSGAYIYLPKRLSNSLYLDKEMNRSLITFSVGNYGFLLVKDTALADALKPQILNLRKRLMFKEVNQTI